MALNFDFPGFQRLHRAEKRDFRRVIRARSDLGMPVRTTEYDALADYVRSRSRISLLTILAERERMSGYPKDYLAAVRAIEAATVTSRRLAQDLGLIAASNRLQKSVDRQRPAKAKAP